MDKKALIKDIDITFDTLRGELSKFDEKTLNQSPFAGSWTAGQVAEHIVICGSGIPDSQTTETDRPFDEKANAIKELFLNFELKFETDPSIAPGTPPHNGEELLQKIKATKLHLEEETKTKELKALCKDMELPTFGLLTRYEWLRFILFHTQRHTHQIVGIGKHLASIGH